MSPTTSSVAQNLFYAQNQLIDITYIQKLSTFFFNIIVNELNNKGMKIIK